jgi:single-stranded-DNA-specific exonuclease
MYTHKILRIAKPDTALQNRLSRDLGISNILAQILINRGLNNNIEAQNFLNVKIEHLLDPYSFSQMHKSVHLIRKAYQNKEKILLFGDYDVDGITSLTLLKTTLERAGLSVEHYLPHRIKEGYGLTKNILSHLKEKNIKLLITADCGITNYKEIEGIRRNNIDVIVTDHHEPKDQDLPPASSIINPKIKDSQYKFRDLAGVGVAYKLCQAVSDSMLLEDLDLVSLGTIADNAPLIGENRIIAKKGLDLLSQTKRLGLRTIIEKAGLKDRKFTSSFVSFILGPRINASGRVDSAEASLNLLMSQNQEEAVKFATIIEAHNRERQKIENKILQEARDLIEREINFKEHKVIVIAKEAWHEGVLGIVASKLVDMFHRPVIVISKGIDLCRGSARSIKNFHLFQALLECKKFLNSFGGHSHAAGLVIREKAIADFKRSINEIAAERLTLEDLLPTLDIDMELSLSDLNEKIILEFERLEPFGQANTEPLFYTRNLKLRKEPCVLSRDTLKFWVTDGNLTFQAVGFGMGCFKDNLINSDYFDLVYTTRIDSWQGGGVVFLEVKEIFFR